MVDFSQRLQSIWAKSGDGLGHSLLHHMLDVAAVTETILAFEPAATMEWAINGFGLPPESASRWLATLAGLHDFGKAIPGFQSKWVEGMHHAQAHGLRFTSSSSSVTRHDLATAALLGRELHALVSAQPNWLQHLVLAVSAHHGYHFLPNEVNNGKPLHEPPDWQRVRREIIACYWQVMLPIGVPTKDGLALPAINWLAGLTSVADWIASNPSWFELGHRNIEELGSYYEHALRLARSALNEIGWRQYQPLLTQHIDTDTIVARIVGKPGLTARPLQQAADRLLRDVQGPSLLIVEAPMGEGKTELAFLAHLRLQAVNGHRGMYVALPTQATGNALFTRALTFLEQFANGALDVQLVHGGAAMNEEVRHLRGIDDSRYASLSASAWFAQRKRPLLSAYGVGTVDQALLAALNVKHHFVRLWGLSNRVIVLDEVHAYDTYTSGLIEALLRWLQALNCSVVLMSATLPQARRSALLTAWGVDHTNVEELDYPRLLLAGGNGVRGAHFATRPLAPVHLAGLGEGLDEIAAAAIALLEGGGCGAVIVNTVERAQKLHSLLTLSLGAEVTLVLFHARFPADERSERERQVLNLFGTQGSRPSRAMLIATQVAEQSLDIDFDFMLSDLAPVDLLLQRIGRLHRHTRQRPPLHARAHVHVAGLRVATLPDLDSTSWRYVYDPYILLRTWALLCEESVLNLPSDIDRLVQVVYSDEPLPAGLEEKARAIIEIDAYGEHVALVKHDRMLSFNIAIDPAEELESAYGRLPRGSEEGEGIGLENKTRLGREAVTLIPVEQLADGWCVSHGDRVFSPDRPIDDDLARRLYGRQLKVSRSSLVRHLKATELPEAFSHPLLRNCYPLQLQQGRYMEGGLQLRLDEVLGLVYEPADESIGATA